MSHFFVDTDVIIDYLTDRAPFAADAEVLFNASARGHIKLYISTATYNNAYYIIKQVLGHASAIGRLKDLEKLVETLSVSHQTILHALYSDFADFEDAIQNECAGTVKELAAIVTRNTKDYKHSTLPVLLPAAAVAML